MARIVLIAKLMPSRSGTVYAIRNLHAKPNPASNMLLASLVPTKQMRMILVWVRLGIDFAIRARVPFYMLTFRPIRQSTIVPTVAQ